MKGEPYNFKEIVEETKDYLNSKGYQSWKEQEALNKSEGSTSGEWLVGYKACLVEITKAFGEIMKKYRVVNDGN